MPNKKCFLLNKPAPKAASVRQQSAAWAVQALGGVQASSSPSLAGEPNLVHDEQPEDVSQAYGVILLRMVAYARPVKKVSSNFLCGDIFILNSPRRRCLTGSANATVLSMATLSGSNGRYRERGASVAPEAVGPRDRSGLAEPTAGQLWREHSVDRQEKMPKNKLF